MSPSLGGGGDFHDSGQMIVIIFPSFAIRPSVRPFIVSAAAAAAAQSNEREFYELCDIWAVEAVEAVGEKSKQ